MNLFQIGMAVVSLVLSIAAIITLANSPGSKNPNVLANGSRITLWFFASASCVVLHFALSTSILTLLPILPLVLIFLFCIPGLLVSGDFKRLGSTRDWCHLFVILLATGWSFAFPILMPYTIILTSIVLLGRAVKTAWSKPYLSVPKAYLLWLLAFVLVVIMVFNWNESRWYHYAYPLSFSILSGLTWLFAKLEPGLWLYTTVQQKYTDTCQRIGNLRAVIEVTKIKNDQPKYSELYTELRKCKRRKAALGSTLNLLRKTGLN